MRYLSEEELSQMDKGGSLKWVSEKMQTGPGYGLPDLEAQTKFMFQCLRCKAHFTSDECANCGGVAFEVASGGSPGLFCKRCERGFTNWKCTKCGTENPAATTFYILKGGGCFIATAAAGTVHHPDVHTLTEFRDVVLLPSRAGRAFVAAYYAVSPPIARAVARRHTLRAVVLAMFVHPAAVLYRWFGQRRRPTPHSPR